jgi:uncharacterized protein (DUF2235 family)
MGVPIEIYWADEMGLKVNPGVYLVRGTIDEAKIAELEAHPDVIRVFSRSALSEVFGGWRVRRKPAPPTPVPSPTRQGRHIVVFLDGTNNTPEELRNTGKYDLLNPPPITNVVRLMRGVITDDTQTDNPQVIAYFRGVGTQGSTATRLIDMATGRGLSQIIVDAYTFISNNLEWTGDYVQRGLDKIFIFGFSRGAFAARALSGFLDRLGLLKKSRLFLLPHFFQEYQKLLSSGRNFDPRTEGLWQQSVQGEYKSIPVHFLGVWDTVGALGIPVKGLSWLTANYESFHDTRLTENVSHAYHALAIHELRPPFRPVFWNKLARPDQVLEQVWFAGAHANIGGGYRDIGLSTHALDWMAYKAAAAGLRLNMKYFEDEILPYRRHDGWLANSRTLNHGQNGFIGSQNAYWRVFRRPISHSDIDTYLEKTSSSGAMDLEVFNGMKIHWSVSKRLSVKKQIYSAERKHFESLDEAAKLLPQVADSESLFPT